MAFEISVHVIRYAFDRGAVKTSRALEKHVPASIVSELDLQYSPNDNDAYLDVYYPEKIKDTDKYFPVVVWVHGGAWVSGDKKDVANYAKIIASKGYAVVSVGYSISPKKRYPTPVIQTNQALGYLNNNAKRLHIDSNYITLAGDSAGSQIVAQVATIITNQKYAKKMKIKPSLTVQQLRSVILNCGVFDMNLPNYEGLSGKFFHTPIIRAYSGKKDFLHNEPFKMFSVVNYVTKDFPPSFITVGNFDPLEQQSTDFANKLNRLGVKTDTLFFVKDHEPKLSHEYQFNLDTIDGQQALSRMVSFLKKHLQ